jgi:hypothetical protein
VAALIGIALGFGAGYMIAIRDRVGGPSPPAPAARVETPAGNDFTEAPVAAAPVGVAPIVEKPVAPPPALAATAFAGRVLVRSTPSGARVFVDGKDRGQTPTTIPELARGEHRFRIVRDGYTTAERRVVLSPSQPSQSLSVPLAKEPRARAKTAPLERVPPQAPARPAVESTPAMAGTLVIESRPQGATVIIDGRQMGTTPLSLGDVRVGSHAVRLERDGYRLWTAPVKVTAGEQNRVTASLEK